MFASLISCILLASPGSSL
ncbi:hypothetical protein EC950183_4998, partial [Escherichia coli 95.0183]